MRPFPRCPLSLHSAVSLLLSLPKGLLLVWLLSVLALTGLFWQNRTDHLHQAEIDGSNLAWVLESRLEVTLRRIDADLAELAAALPAGVRPEKRSPCLGREGKRLLHLHAVKFREVTELACFDAQGRRVVSSAADRVSFDISDREYFRHLRADPSAGLVFSDVLTVRPGGQPTIVAARALHDQKGNFQGVVAFLVNLEHFSQLLDVINLGQNGAIAIRRSDSSNLVLRRPAMPELINQPVSYSVYEHIAAGQKIGVEYLKSPSDGSRRISAFRALDSYPFYIVVAQAERDVLAEWYSQTVVSTGVALILLGGFLFLNLRLTLSERNFRSLFESIDDFVFVLDENKVIRHVNRTVLDRLGYAETGLIGRNLLDLRPPERRDEVLHCLTEMLAGRLNYCQLPLQAAGGMLLPVESRLVRGFWNGRPALFAVCRDISERIRQQQALEDEIARRRLVLDRSRDGICLLRTDGGVVEFNPAFANMLGYPADEIGKMRVHDWDCQLPVDEIEQIIHQLGMGHMQIETRHRRKDGSEFEVEVSISGIEWAGEYYLFCLHRDISARKQTEEALRLSELRFRTIIESSPIPYALNDDQLNITYLNPAFIRTFGYSRDDIPTVQDWWPKAYPDAEYRQWIMASWQDHMERAEREKKPFEPVEAEIRCKSGEIRTALITASPLASSLRDLHVVSLVDITERKVHETQLKHIANHDGLTSLPNRLLFADRLQLAMAQAKRRGVSLAVLYLDLDGFKLINDNHGHDVGDQLLLALASRLKHALREGDTLARIGGDEFVGVLIDLPEPQACLPVLDRLIAAAAGPVCIAGRELQVSASLGVTFYPGDDAADSDQLLRQADQAMYQAKESGKNRYHLYSEAAFSTEEAVGQKPNMI